MQYHRVSYEKLVKFCVECFKGYGFNEEQARQITDVLWLLTCPVSNLTAFSV